MPAPPRSSAPDSRSSGSSLAPALGRRVRVAALGRSSPGMCSPGPPASPGCPRRTQGRWRSARTRPRRPARRRWAARRWPRRRVRRLVGLPVSPSSGAGGPIAPQPGASGRASAVASSGTAASPGSTAPPAASATSASVASPRPPLAALRARASAAALRPRPLAGLGLGVARRSACSASPASTAPLSGACSASLPSASSIVLALAGRGVECGLRVGELGLLGHGLVEFVGAGGVAELGLALDDVAVLVELGRLLDAGPRLGHARGEREVLAQRPALEVLDGEDARLEGRVVRGTRCRTCPRSRARASSRRGRRRSATGRSVPRGRRGTRVRSATRLPVEVEYSTATTSKPSSRASMPNRQSKKS